MKDLDVKLKELEMRIHELDKQLDLEKEANSSYLNENDVRALLDTILTDKEYITQKELENEIRKNYLNLVKWIIGTGISIASIVAGVISFS